MNNFLSIKKWTQSSKNKTNESLIEKSENDPDYEVVEFINENPIHDSFYNEPKPLSEQIKNEVCHFCPNNIPAAVYCLDCDRLSFCDQCDLVFHKHPKRVDHKRKIKLEQFKPPLPPKQMLTNQESKSVQAPLPPPRRNKLQPPLQQSLNHQQADKNNTLIRSSKLQLNSSSFSTFSLTKKLSNLFLNNHGSSATLDRKSVSKTNLSKVSNVDHNRYLDWRKNINSNNSKYRSQLLFNGNSNTKNVENRLDEFKRCNNISVPIANSCSVMDLSQNFQYSPQNFALNGYNRNPWMVNNGYPYPRAQWPQMMPLMSNQNNCMMHSCCGSMVSIVNECEKKPFSKQKKVSTSNLSSQSSRRNFSCLSDLSSSPSSSSSENITFDDNIRLRNNHRNQNRNRNHYKNRNRKPLNHRNGNSFGSKSTLSTSESRKKSLDFSSSSYDDKFVKNKPMNHWKCKYCTFTNKQNSNVCVMCSKTHFNFEKEKISSRSSSSSMNYSENRLTNELEIGERQKNAVTKELSEIVSSLINLRLNEIENRSKINEKIKYSDSEMEIAKTLTVSNNEEDLILWLKNDWIEMIKNVQSLVSKHLENFVSQGKGHDRSKPVTFEYAKNALIENKGNILSAINQCIENQTKEI